jgi:hypothetical protein
VAGFFSAGRRAGAATLCVTACVAGFGALLVVVPSAAVNPLATRQQTVSAASASLQVVYFKDFKLLLSTC